MIKSQLYDYYWDTLQICGFVSCFKIALDKNTNKSSFKNRFENFILMSFDDFYLSIHSTVLDCIPRKVKGV